jgi:hypothetical protein
MIDKLVESAKTHGEELLNSFKILVGVDEDLKAREEYRNSFHTDSFSSLLPYLGWHDGAELFILDSGDINDKANANKGLRLNPRRKLGQMIQWKASCNHCICKLPQAALSVFIFMLHQILCLE